MGVTVAKGSTIPQRALGAAPVRSPQGTDSFDADIPTSSILCGALLDPGHDGRRSRRIQLFSGVAQLKSKGVVSWQRTRIAIQGATAYLAGLSYRPRSGAPRSAA